MSAAALYSLDSPACYKSWCLEPANFYDAKVGSGGGPGPACNGTNLAELSAAAPAMYEDESAIDFSSYIDSMSAVPNLELCNDELFADLFNSNHKPERGGEYGEYLPPGGGAGRDPPCRAVPRRPGPGRARHEARSRGGTCRPAAALGMRQRRGAMPGSFTTKLCEKGKKKLNIFFFFSSLPLNYFCNGSFRLFYILLIPMQLWYIC
uniref:CCAAT enhancer binding protein delta n=1 Tax=Taeniopygia guttata TaxID=59729 RepID=H0ZKQ0_TAEGU